MLVIEDREASLVAKYAFAEPRDWATASQAMRATDRTYRRDAAMRPNKRV
jgi:hypothetical protein